MHSNALFRGKTEEWFWDEPVEWISFRKTRQHFRYPLDDHRGLKPDVLTYFAASTVRELGELAQQSENLEKHLSTGVLTNHMIISPNLEPR